MRDTVALAKASNRDHELANIAKEHGANFSLRIVIEARDKDIPISLGFALIQQETGFQNIYGHDPTIYVGAGPVTAHNYHAYKKVRGPHGEGGMQGVGPGQLTWWAIQDEADKRGGCHETSHNISTSFDVLAALIRKHGYVNGVAAYNGDGARAARYSRIVRASATVWHARFT